jgi:transcriptional regulator with XRE-family HTH domain
MLTIEFARRLKKLTQLELSATTRISAQFIGLIENGRGLPTDDQARRLAEALGVSADQLLVDVAAAAETSVIAPSVEATRG